MRTTLKRGFGRAAEQNGNGYGGFPPGLIAPMVRYRQPPPGGSGIGSRLGKFFFILLVVVLMVAGGAAGGLYLYGQDFANALAPHSAATKRAAKRLDYVAPGQPAIALVIGSDYRFLGAKASSPAAWTPGQARSDTLMLIRTDPAGHVVTMLSLPRDLRVPIHCPGKSIWFDKINAAYSYCGPTGSVETVKALTGVPINYLINVNFLGFIQVVDALGGIWLDIDRRYFNNHTGPGGYAAINLEPGYQKLDGKHALDFVRYRHTDSDVYRVARQQMFVRAAKSQLARFSKLRIFSLLKALKQNVEIARAGGSGVDLQTMINYALFFHSLGGGHFVQVRIQGLEGMSYLTTATQNITDAVQQFMNPDVAAPQKANAAALNEKYQPKVTGLKPRDIFITVLNGNGVTGSASLAGTQLHASGYEILQPPNGITANAPGGWNYAETRIYYDSTQQHSKQAAKQVAALFGSAQTGPMTPLLQSYANGAMLVVVVGKTYQGALAASAPVNPVPQHQAPHTAFDPGATLSLMRAIRGQVPFRIEYPTVIDRTSQPDYEQPNPRVYSIDGAHKAIRLVFNTGVAGEYWGVEETNWSGAPALSERNFVRHFGGRTFQFFYSGSHLHMVVLQENGASYWVVNTLIDSLSNETMIAIARGLRPLS
ncbi:MAG TPA: LCP family protein [Gaiellaceae bacterium]